MHHPVYNKQKKRLATFVYAVILLVGLSFTTGCTDIPVALGLGVVSGISYYAYKNVNEKKEDKKEKKPVVEQKQKNDIEGAETTMKTTE